jgi:hypothetical protein
MNMAQRTVMSSYKFRGSTSSAELSLSSSNNRSVSLAGNYDVSLGGRFISSKNHPVSGQGDWFSKSISGSGSNLTAFGIFIGGYKKSTAGDSRWNSRSGSCKKDPRRIADRTPVD